MIRRMITIDTKYYDKQARRCQCKLHHRVDTMLTQQENERLGKKPVTMTIL